MAEPLEEKRREFPPHPSKATSKPTMKNTAANAIEVGIVLILKC